jgi:acyl-CoA dehydrogenase
MGWKSSDTAELFFDNVKVPAHSLSGQRRARLFLHHGELSVRALDCRSFSIAGCEYALDITLKYMQERSAFGKPIAKYQALRHRLVDLITEVEVTKRFVYYCCDLYARGIFAVKECSMAKMKGAELGKSGR